MSLVAWFVCLCVYFGCVGHTGELCKNGLTDRDALVGVDSCGSKESCIRWGPDPPMGRGSSEGTCQPFNVPMHECIARSSAVGGCACPGHAVDECICCLEGWQDDDADVIMTMQRFGKVPWMLVYIVGSGFMWKVSEFSCSSCILAPLSTLQLTSCWACLRGNSCVFFVQVSGIISSLLSLLSLFSWACRCYLRLSTSADKVFSLLD